MAWPFYDDYPRSGPIEARGGIKAQSRRGDFGQSWWARRWVAALEDLLEGGRLSRGRSYARRGQVLSVEVEEGAVAARVQGSRAKPYKVDIAVETLESADLENLSEALARRPVFVAKLLAGEMPESIEDVFWDVGISLFPETAADLETECSCPDWSNPCKHIAAVYLLLGEEFDRDPFLMFKLCGVDRERLLEMAGFGPSRNGATERDPAGRDARQSPPEPLPSDPALFWEPQDAGDGQDAAGPAGIPEVAAALPKRLGNFPFWRGERAFIAAMEEVYGAASAGGREVYLGGVGDDAGDGGEAVFRAHPP